MYVLSIIVCPFVLFLFAIVLCVLLRYTFRIAPLVSSNSSDPEPTNLLFLRDAARHFGKAQVIQVITEYSDK
jgi:hypothetical protein